MIINGGSNTSNTTALGKIWRTLPIEIAKGNVDGVSYVNKFGYNPAIATGNEDVWGFGGNYVYSTTADIDSISSSNATDTQKITIIGLDTNWAEVTQTATLNGQTKVTLTTPLVRVYRMYNIGTTDIAGVVYCYVDDTITAGVPDTDANVRAIITGAYNQTLMAIYTVPAGKTGYFTQGYVSLANKNAADATFQWEAREYGGIFRTQSIVDVNSNGNSGWQYKYSVPPALPEKTDVVIHIIETSAAVAVSGGFDIILVDN